ncbi:tyrosine-type recombinase/integrase [Enterococcus sp. LJL120]
MVRKGENIYKRKDGRWEGRYISARTSSGKIRYSSIYGKKYEDVKKKLIEKKAEPEKISREASPNLKQSYKSYSSWLSFWINNIEITRVKKTTLSIYTRLIEVHISPSLGNYPLKKLSAEMITSFLVELQKKSYLQERLEIFLI